MLPWNLVGLPEAVSSLPWMGNPPKRKLTGRKKYIAKNPNGCSVEKLILMFSWIIIPLSHC